MKSIVVHIQNKMKIIRTGLRLLDQLYPGFQNALKKSTINVYEKDMLEILSVKSAGVNQLIEELERIRDLK